MINFLPAIHMDTLVIVSLLAVSPLMAHAWLLQIAAKSIGMVKIDAYSDFALLQFVRNPPIDAMRIIELIQKNQHIKLNG